MIRPFFQPNCQRFYWKVFANYRCSATESEVLNRLFNSYLIWLLRIELSSENKRDKNGVWKGIFIVDITVLVISKPSEGSLITEDVKVI